MLQQGSGSKQRELNRTGTENGVEDPVPGLGEDAAKRKFSETLWPSSVSVLLLYLGGCRLYHTCESSPSFLLQGQTTKQ